MQVGIALSGCLPNMSGCLPNLELSGSFTRIRRVREFWKKMPNVREFFELIYFNNLNLLPIFFWKFSIKISLGRVINSSAILLWWQIYFDVSQPQYFPPSLLINLGTPMYLQKKNLIMSWYRVKTSYFELFWIKDIFYEKNQQYAKKN